MLSWLSCKAALGLGLSASVLFLCFCELESDVESAMGSGQGFARTVEWWAKGRAWSWSSPPCPEGPPAVVVLPSPHILHLFGFSTTLLFSCSVVSDSVRPHRWQPTRLLPPWDFPGKNTGVGCHFLLQCIKVKSESEVAQSCPTLSDPMDYSPPGSSVHGIFQARVL